jgi:hypothetical protein
MLGRTARFVMVLIAGLAACSPARSQEVDATVTVNYEAVPTTNKDLLRDFESDLKNYLNNYQWGNDKLDEKIRCTFNIFVQGVVGDDRYSAQIFVGSQRKLFGSDKASAVLRLFDDSWEFTYVKNRPINHNGYSFNDLASLLDFYVYIIIGYDYDTYERLSGSPFFQRAADIASLGRSSGLKAWQSGKSGYNKSQFIDELNDGKFSAVRTASYYYYFSGMDSLGINKNRAWDHILKSLDVIAKTKAAVDPRNVVIKSWFDTKYMELAETFQEYPDRAVYIKLSNIDPSHQKTYEEYRAKPRNN